MEQLQRILGAIEHQEEGDNLVTLAKYAHDKNIVYQQGWTWARKIIKNPTKFKRMSKLMVGQKK